MITIKFIERKWVKTKKYYRIIDKATRAPSRIIHGEFLTIETLELFLRQFNL